MFHPEMTGTLLFAPPKPLRPDLGGSPVRPFYTHDGQSMTLHVNTDAIFDPRFPPQFFLQARYRFLDSLPQEKTNIHIETYAFSPLFSFSPDPVTRRVRNTLDEYTLHDIFHRANLFRISVTPKGMHIDHPRLGSVLAVSNSMRPSLDDRVKTSNPSVGRIRSKYDPSGMNHTFLWTTERNSQADEVRVSLDVSLSSIHFSLIDQQIRGILEADDPDNHIMSVLNPRIRLLPSSMDRVTEPIPELPMETI
ncbi:MAG: hypothetical protein AAB508_05175 [Patescibacteria group bacterium]